MSEAGLLLIILGAIAIAVMYGSSERLSNCASCGKHLTVKMNRYWYTKDGENVPVCTKCNKKLS
ncbi:hypothetical protein CJF42_24935 [Pseudoalteromonas sp. NBT06-2]|uniref:hypothetical protein n=1 Tax=Pseudoalteromonas sp. NBT06-2 TaxID=2025950 RepID=UPI000BA58723|nr:hypothetical protein [Pseudoalteromonas sp. NBT06-2]PAJ71767.1 hypothetical protein CJF42_24935 [Pseudoalteromonas sp. NBT06-2]